MLFWGDFCGGYEVASSAEEALEDRQRGHCRAALGSPNTALLWEGLKRSCCDFNAERFRRCLTTCQLVEWGVVSYAQVFQRHSARFATENS